MTTSPSPPPFSITLALRLRKRWGGELTKEPTVNFSRLSGLRLVLPRRPSHWRNALDKQPGAWASS